MEQLGIKLRKASLRDRGAPHRCAVTAPGLIFRPYHDMTLHMFLPLWGCSVISKMGR